MSVIRWEDPRAYTKATAFDATWAEVADELRVTPNRWAVIFEGRYSEAGNLAQKIKGGTGPFAPKGTFEAVTRTLPIAGNVARCAVYARHLGGTS